MTLDEILAALGESVLWGYGLGFGFVVVVLMLGKSERG